MTNEKAIQLLHRLSDEQFDGPHGDERREALEMAVMALSGDGDTISRKAVMKEFSNFVRRSNNSDFAPTPTWNDAVSLVGSMPSAQPETLACGSGELVQESGGLVQDLVNDCISRQQAIDDLGEEPEVWEDDDEYGMGMRAEWCRIKKIIEKLPSAQPVNYRSTKSDSSSQLKLNNDLISRQALCEYALNQKR